MFPDWGRRARGPFTSREQIREVPGLGPKAYEQAAGFLRVRNAAYPLDASAVHPEAYPVVERIAADLGCTVKDLLSSEQIRRKINLQQYVTEAVGLPTLTDIQSELAKPGRDPRPPFQIFRFKEGIATLDDLSPGMTLPGVVTNITAFGAFVDVGVHHDGLVHVSELSDRFIKDPHEVVKVHQQVTVKVLEVDARRQRIALSMRRKQ